MVQDQLQTPNEVEAEGGCCWANLPQELLWEVLLRIEESESSWPQRKNVVACAGVCSSWRFIIKQIVKLPQLSGKLTFPVSVKQVRFLVSYFLGIFIFIQGLERWYFSMFSEDFMFLGILY